VDDLSIRPAIPNAIIPDIGAGAEKPNVSAIPGTAAAAENSFKDTVKQLLSDVNDKLVVSDQNTQDLAMGKTNDIQKVVTSVEEANLALQYTMAVRTKLLDAYQEISRMQL
jgi:flagellar hook-basal body complex protein FliE